MNLGLVSCGVPEDCSDVLHSRMNEDGFKQEFKKRNPGIRENPPNIITNTAVCLLVP